MWTNRLFFRFLISYIMVMLIPIIVCGVAYSNVIKIVECDTQEDSLSALEQCMVVLDRRLIEIERIATELSLNTKIRNFSYESSPYTDLTLPYKINRLKQEMATLMSGNDFIEMLCVYFEKSDVIISNTHSFLSLDQFYNTYFKYADMSKEEWKDNILSNKYFNQYFPAMPMQLGFKGDAKSFKSEPMIMYVKSFPSATWNKGQIMIYIPENRIKELFRNINIDEGGWAYILDSEGEVLSVFPKANQTIDPDNINLHQLDGPSIQNIKGQKMIVNCKTSSYNGWKYIAVLPYGIIMERVEYIKQIIILVLFISMLSGLIVAFFMTYKNCKPISNIFDMLQKLVAGDKVENDVCHELGYMRKSVLNLILDNKSMYESLKRQLPILKTIFIERLLLGNFSNDYEIQWFLDQLGLVRFSGNIAVVISQIDHLTLEGDSHVTEMSAIKLIIEDAVHKYIGTDVYYYDLDFDKQVIIFDISKITDFDNESYLEEILSNIGKDIYEVHNINVYFSIGSVVENYMEVSNSYDEAREALEYKMLDRRNGKFVIWYSEVPKEQEGYSYPLKIEERLINFAKLGDRKKIEEILKRVYKENFIKRELSYSMMIQLIYEIKGTLLKVLDILAVDQKEVYKQFMKRINSLDDYKSIDEMFVCIVHIFNQVCDLAEENRKNKSANTIDSILDYIHANYSDPQISLMSIAEEFGFAPAYLSQLFKEKTGENFSTYLERFRIEKACELLKEDTKINQVAKEVGYNSVYVFRKAFKRNKGMVPSEYKNTELKEFIL